MTFKFPSFALAVSSTSAILCGVLLLTTVSCGEKNDSAALPGPVQVSGTDFVSANEYQFTPGSSLETTGMRLDFVNPTFDKNVIVRNSPNQGSGDARITNVPAVLGAIDLTSGSGSIGIKIDAGVAPLTVNAFATNDARLQTQADISGLVLIANSLNDQRLRVGSTFASTALSSVPNTPSGASSTGSTTAGSNSVPPPAPNVRPSPDSGSNVLQKAFLRLQVTRILVNASGTQVIVEGSAYLESLNGVVDLSGTGKGTDDKETKLTLSQGSFSSSFTVRQRGVAGNGSGEDPLTLLARLNFTPNQAEVVYTPNQVGTQSFRYTPDPRRQNVLTNQLVKIQRLLNGRVQAQFDPANVSTVLNFIQINQPAVGFPTPIAQLPTPIPGAPNAGGLPPNVFDYFFALRTARNDTSESPVVIEGLVPLTGDFLFRNLAGSQLAGPFNRADIGGNTLRGNLNLVFSDNTTNSNINGQFYLEQDFPNVGTSSFPDGANTPGSIIIIRGNFTGAQVAL